MFKTAFSITKNSFNKWPIIETSDMDLYNQADAYKDKVPYVWFVNPDYIIREDFNWNFRPEDQNRFSVHSFPRCFNKSKRPVNWDVVKLVPTDPRYRQSIDIKKNIISSLTEAEYPVYVYSFNDRFSVKKMSDRSKNNQHRLIKSRKSLNEILLNLNLDYIEDYVWLVDIDVSIDEKFYFDFVPPSANSVYMFKLLHKSTNLVYGDYNFILVPKKYIMALQNNLQDKFTFDEVDIKAGELDDMTDPKKAWERAFSTACSLIQHNFPNKDRRLKNKILSAYISQSSSRMHDYIKDACECAVKQNEKSYIDIHFFQNYQWLEEVFNERQEFLRIGSVKTSQQRLDIIKRIYGLNSDQYKEYELKLKTV